MLFAAEKKELAIGHTLVGFLAKSTSYSLILILNYVITHKKLPLLILYPDSILF